MANERQLASQPNLEILDVKLSETALSIYPVTRINLSSYAHELERICQDELLSVIAYTQPVERQNMRTHLMAILYEVNLPLLQQLRELTHIWWERDDISISFASYRELLESTDAFAVEFLQMIPSYQCLYGEDILAKLNLNWDYLRQQLENSLRQQLTSFRKQYVHDGHMVATLRLLVAESYRQIQYLRDPLLYLKGQHLSREQATSYKHFVQGYELDEKALRPLQALVHPFESSKFSLSELEDMALGLEQLLLQLIESVSDMQQPLSLSEQQLMAV